MYIRLNTKREYVAIIKRICCNHATLEDFGDEIITLFLFDMHTILYNFCGLF